MLSPKSAPAVSQEDGLANTGKTPSGSSGVPLTISLCKPATTPPVSEGLTSKDSHLQLSSEDYPWPSQAALTAHQVPGGPETMAD